METLSRGMWQASQKAINSKQAPGKTGGGRARTYGTITLLLLQLLLPEQEWHGTEHQPASGANLLKRRPGFFTQHFLVISLASPVSGKPRRAVGRHHRPGVWGTHGAALWYSGQTALCWQNRDRHALLNTTEWLLPRLCFCSCNLCPPWLSSNCLWAHASPQHGALVDVSSIRHHTERTFPWLPESQPLQSSIGSSREVCSGF